MNDYDTEVSKTFALYTAISLLIMLICGCFSDDR